MHRLSLSRKCASTSVAQRLHTVSGWGKLAKPIGLLKMRGAGMPRNGCQPGPAQQRGGAGWGAGRGPATLPPTPAQPLLRASFGPSAAAPFNPHVPQRAGRGTLCRAPKPRQHPSAPHPSPERAPPPPPRCQWRPSPIPKRGRPLPRPVRAPLRPLPAAALRRRVQAPWRPPPRPPAASSPTLLRARRMWAPWSQSRRRRSPWRRRTPTRRRTNARMIRLRSSRRSRGTTRGKRCRTACRSTCSRCKRCARPPPRRDRTRGGTAPGSRSRGRRSCRCRSTTPPRRCPRTGRCTPGPRSASARG
mmetsp:Transcript_9353/g.23757  ORF Transcript_9353/g.23757 Transcript_9353/m.23757 type:complete len:303 (+) Transcript_9353:49-957(+)